MEKEHKSKIEKVKRSVANAELKVPESEEGKGSPKSSEKSTPDKESPKDIPEKSRVSKTKKEIPTDDLLLPAPDKTLKIEKPKPSKSTRTSKQSKYAIPFSVFVVAVLFIAFGIGALFAQFIPPISFDYFVNLRNKQSDEIVLQDGIESAPFPIVDIPPQEIQDYHILTTQPPEIAARAYGVYKLVDGRYVEITNKNPEMPLPLASITKVMTAIIALERYDLDKPVVVPAKCVGINGSSVGFKANEVFTLQDMLYGLLVKSGADAACSIANIDNESEFLIEMNSRAKEIGMEQTAFTNAIGFDYDTHLSNINDIKALVTHALQFSTFRKIVGTGEITLTSKSSGASYRIRNTNQLLFSIPGTVGLKTGYTDGAGECLTYLYQNRDTEIMIIILGSANRFGDTAKLLEWTKGELNSENL